MPYSQDRRNRRWQSNGQGSAMRRRVVLGALAIVIAFGGALATSGGGLRTARATDANVVIDWNGTMLAPLAPANVPAAPGTRDAAIVQAALFDAVHGIG